ncbi:MAG TPA: immunoglobulin domain-containing protein [Verrucomicrobiales bacterium]|nr:immunoglobulin domain-containing protein [Verrucomicrobiales bacterium]
MSSLLMMLQRSPVLPLLPEARVISTSGFGEVLKWSVAAIAGLGGYDSVTGASAVTQLAPSPGSFTVNVVAGDPLTFAFQLTGETYVPALFEVQGTLPAGLVQTGTENSTVDSITGTPTEAGVFPVTLIAWETPAMSGFSARSPYTINVSLPPVPSINSHPVAGNFSTGAFVSLALGQANGKAFTWKLNDEALPASETVLVEKTAPRKFIVAPATNPGDGWRSGADFNDSSWTSVSGGIGYDNEPIVNNYLPHIADGGNTGSAMSGSGKPVAAHVRIPFTVSGPHTLSYLKLRVQCDDGFVAWLNGTELSSPQNKPASFQWNSAASADAVDSTAITFREIDISQHLGLLRAGENLLAVQAMNRTNSSPDFLFNCELAAGINATNSPRLLLTSFQMSDAGTYTVTASNLAGSVTSNPAAVLLLPQITGQPESMTIPSGTSAELHVTASGSPPFTFQWYRGNSGDTANPVAGAADETFTTPNLTANTTYWVRVTSPAGTVDSGTATITVVNAPPSITTQPASTAINNGATAQLSVAATGTPPFTYQWYRGASGDISAPVDGATLASFTTPALTATTSYWVRVTNVLNSVDSNTAVVSVNAPANPYTAWRNDQFSPEQSLNEAIAGTTADPDGDGLTNEEEYIFGTLPLTATESLTPVITTTGTQTTLTFTAVRSTGPGYDGRSRLYTIESAASAEAGPWVAVEDFTDITGTGQTVTFNPAQDGTRKFFRLKVRLSP